VGQGTAAVNEGSDATPGIDNEHENEHEHDSGIRGFGGGTTHLDQFLQPVPLTTVHYPCREGAAAVASMLERIVSPETPRPDILLDCRLVVRESCGGRASAYGISPIVLVLVIDL
jgi:hypothetical protein